MCSTLKDRVNQELLAFFEEDAPARSAREEVETSATR
jgi:hypothetical protein